MKKTYIEDIGFGVVFALGVLFIGFLLTAVIKEDSQLPKCISGHYERTGGTYCTSHRNYFSLFGTVDTYCEPMEEYICDRYENK